MNIFVYSDESGVFDVVHNKIYVFAGRVFLSKEEKNDYKIRLSRISTPGLNQRIGGKNKILGEM